MAAGAYKGLTIRIGADTTKLSSALRGANSAIYKAQTELNRLNKAAKLDPGNMGVVTAQMGAIAEQAINAASKIDNLKQGIEALGNTNVASGGSTTISQLAANTESMTLAAERAKVAYDEVDKAQSELYKKIKQYAKVDIGKVTREGNYSDEWLDKQTGIKDKDKDAVKALKKEWDQASKALSDYSDVARLQSLNNDLAVQQASIRSLSNQIVDMSRSMSAFDRYNSKSFSGLGEQLASVNDRLVLVSSASEVAGERFRALSSAMTLDYGGMDVMTERTDALNNAIEAAEMKAELLQQRVSAYEDAGVGRLAQDMGNVAIEVQQAEAAFKSANTELVTMRANGDTSSQAFRQVEKAVQQAQLRMDTAHAVQQYQNLKTQLHEVRSEAIDLAGKLVDLNRPSSVAATSDVRRISDDIKFVGDAMRTAQTDAHSLDAALKLNPENIDLVTKKSELLGRASQLAAKEAEELGKKLSSYDASAIKKATDPTKTAAEQILDARNNFESANDAIRETETSMAKLQQAIDGIDLVHGGEEAHETFASLNDQMRTYIERLHEQRQAAAEAGNALDLSKQRAEYEQVEVAQVKNLAASQRFAAEARGLANINITPRFDMSFADQMRSAFDQIQSGAAVEQAMGGIADRLKDIGAAADDADDRFSRLDAALELDPTNIGVAQQRAVALADAMTATDRKTEALTAAMKAIPVELIDKAAIANGTVAEKVSESSRRYDEAANRAKGYQDTINAISAELGKLESQDAISDGDAEKIENMKAQMDLLIQSMRQFADEDKNAFDDMSSAVATQKWQEMNVQLTESKAHAVELAHSYGSLRVPSDIAVGLEDINKQMRLVSDGADAAKSRFDQLNSASKIQPYSLGVAVDKVRALREATDAARQKAEVLKQQLEAYKSAGVDKMSHQISDAAVAFEKANQHVRELQVALEAEKKANGEASEEAQRLAAELEKAERNAKTIGAVNEYRNLEAELRQVQSASKEMQNSMKADLGEVGAAAVTAAQQLGQIAQQAWGQIKESSNDVDAAYRNLRKTFDAEESDYQNLYDSAMKYSQSHVTSADTMLEMEATAAQLGVGMEGGAEAIQAFADAAANLDVATNIDADTIALQMGQIMAVMSDVDYKNIDRFGDALVRLGNNMPTQESNIMQITQRLSAVGNVAGFSTPQLLGWAASVASTGQKSEAAATGLATLITSITAAVDDFDKGGDSLDKFAKVAGVSAEQFAKDWREGPSDALENLIKKLGDSETLFSDLAGMDITSVRQTQTLAALSQTVDKLNDATTMASDAFNGVDDKFGEAGDAAREAEKKAEGFSGSLSKLQNSVQVLSASFGPAFVGVLDWVADKVQWLTDVVSGWSDDFKQSIIMAAGSITIFSTAWNFLQPLGSSLMKFGSGALQFVIGQLAEFKVAMELGKGGFAATTIGMKLGGFATKLGALASSGALATGALAALGIALTVKYAAKAIKAKKDTDRFNAAIDDARGNTKDLYADLINGSSSIDDYGRSWRDAKVDMDDFMSSLEEHNKVQSETREEATESIGMLEKYKSVIDNAAGAGDGYTGSMAELKWAVDGLNEILGTNYDYNEILKGSYEDAEGAAHSYREEIDKLIEAKEREIRIEAMGDLYAEEYKQLEKNKKAYKDARTARREFTQDYIQEHQGDLTRDKWTGEVRQKTRNELISDAHGTDEWQDLNDTVGKTSKAVNESADALNYYDTALTSLIEEGRYAEDGFRGVREGIILDNQAMMDAITASGMFGSSTEEIGGKIKELSKKLMDAKVGTKEFADMAQNHPDVFAGMVEKANGDMDTLVNLISEWNMAELEEKFAGFTYDGTGFVNAEGDRYDWNGTDWEFKEAGVQVDTSQIDKAEKEKEKLNREVVFGIKAEDDGGAKRIIDSLNNTKLDAVTLKFQTEDGGVKSMLDILEQSKAAAKDTIVTKFKADATEIEDAQNIADSLQDKDVLMNLKMGDTDWLDSFSGLIDSLPTNVTTTLTAQTVGVNAASRSIDLLNISAGGMHDVYANYVAGGNAATSHDPSNKIRGVTSAASGLYSKDTWYRVYGNALDSKTAEAIWNVVAAANNLVSKTVDITTNAIKNVITNILGTGTYINPNKIPRHAAGIFTQPTLTNIGWVGESGAELYSGNSLVPLTNRKYSMPYIDDISTAVARKLGAQSTGIDYDLLGQSVAAALVGMSVTIDGQALVGEIATQVQRTSRLYAG